MNRQLLVPLRGGDRIEEVLPYLREIAQPGMTVVFLVHLGANRFKELAAQLISINSGLAVTFDSSVTPEQLTHVERGIQRAAERLRQRGVAIRVKFYSGSLRALMRQCMEDEPVKWVIMHPARSPTLRWCRAIAALLGIVGPPAPAPVLLFDPNPAPHL